MSGIRRLRERWERFISNLEWLGNEVVHCWKCPRCEWLNRKGDDMCLLCPARQGEAKRK